MSVRKLLIQSVVLSQVGFFALPARSSPPTANQSCTNCALQAHAENQAGSAPLAQSGIKLGDFALKLDYEVRGVQDFGADAWKQDGEARSTALFESYLAIYRNITKSKINFNCSRVAPANLESCMRARSLRDRQLNHSAWLQGGATDLQLAVLGVSPLSSSRIALEEVPILRTFHRFMESADADSLLRIAKENPEHLSSHQFVALVGMMGRNLLEQYDKERAYGTSGREQGIVTPDQMLDAAQSNLASRVWWRENHSVPASYSGVCRDIAVFQAKLLEARFGKGSAYVMTLNTTEGGHAIVVAPDPSDPKKLLHINYGQIESTNGTDGASALELALSSGGDITTGSYALFNADGRQISHVPTEIGKLSREAMGLSLSQIDPLARKTASLAKAQVEIHSNQTHPSLTLRLHGFSGDTPSGFQTVGGGAGLIREAPKKSIWKGATEAHLQVMHLERPPMPHESSDSRLLGGQLIQGVVVQKNTPYEKKWRDGVEPSQQLRLSTEVGAESSLALYETRKASPFSSTLVHARAEAEYSRKSTESGDGVPELTLKAGVIAANGKSDVRMSNGQANWSTVIPILTSAYIDAKVAGPFRLMSDTEIRALISMDLLGGRGLLEINQDLGRCDAGLTLSGRLWSNSDQDPEGIVQESALTRLGTELNCRLAQDIHWSTTLETGLETENSTRVMTGIRGSID